MKFLLQQAALLLAMTLPAAAHEGVQITDPYVRILVGSGAVYFMMMNHSATDDQLLSAASPDARMVHLMTSGANADGVMAMSTTDSGFAVAAEESRTLAGAGDHVMLMGVTRKVKTGDTVTVVLTFRNAGEVTLTVPVDNQRTTPPGGGPTAFDAQATVSHAAQMAADPAAHAAAMAADPAAHLAQMAAAAALQAALGATDAPLTVDAFVVQGDSAVASWTQGDAAGRALLARHGDHWQVTLLAGADLRLAAFLAAQGVPDAAALSQMFIQAEDKLGSAAIDRYSRFQGVLVPTPD